MSFFFKTEIFFAIFQRILSQRNNSDNFPLARHGVDSYHVIKITVYDNNLFSSENLG